MSEMITLRGVSSLRAMNEGQSIRDEEEAIRLHAASAFDFSELSSTTKRALRLGGVKISASVTVNGMTTEQVDALLEKAHTAGGPPLTAAQRMAVKLELRSKGILYRQRA